MNVLRAAELQLPTHVAHEISCIAFHPASSALVAAIGSRIYGTLTPPTHSLASYRAIY